MQRYEYFHELSKINIVFLLKCNSYQQHENPLSQLLKNRDIPLDVGPGISLNRNIKYNYLEITLRVLSCH